MTELPAQMISTSNAAARIRAAAIDAFSVGGYGGTTTRDIAARLDMSPAAMYPHYRSKEDLLFAISFEGHLVAHETVAAADRADASPVDRLRSVISTFASWQATHHAQARVIQYELTALTRDHYRTVVALRRETTAIVRSVVNAGVDTGDFIVPDAEGVTLALTSLCVDVCRWFPTGDYTDPQVVGDLYADLAARVVGAR